MTRWLSVACGLSWLPVLAGASSQQAAKPEIKVTVTSGERLVHLLQDRKPQTVVVSVTDAEGRPITGAVVYFKLPDPGQAGGTFIEEETSEERNALGVQTTEQGNAVARGLRPNDVPGAWRINVKVTHLGVTVDIQIPQVNQEACKPGYRPAVPPTGFCVKPGGSGKWIALVAVGGGAAVGAALGLSGGKGGNGGTPQPQPQPPPPPTGTIRTGNITIGPP